MDSMTPVDAMNWPSNPLVLRMSAAILFGPASDVRDLHRTTIRSGPPGKPVDPLAEACCTAPIRIP